jgi:hypothetical protein
MVHIVFVVVLAGGDDLKVAGGLIGPEKVNFASGVAIGNEEEIGAAAGALDVNAKTLVFFLVEENVGEVRAKDVTIEAVRTLGNFVFDDVEESKTVSGPGGAGNAFDAER